MGKSSGRRSLSEEPRETGVSEMADFEMIEKKLAELSCDGWELTETFTEGWEFYFIRHQLDQNRVTEVRTFDVKVYRKSEDGTCLGSASGEISPTASESETEKVLADLFFQASLVKNPAYTLQNQPVGELAAPPALRQEKIAGDFLKVMREIPETETEDINSYEIFVHVSQVHFRNSNGVDTAYVRPHSMLEVVCNARDEEKEIELYRCLTSGTCDPERIRETITEAMHFGRDRLTAVPTPKIRDIPVLFSTSDALEIYGYFKDRTNAALKVQKISPWEIGKPVAAEFRGDRISLEALTALPGSSRNVPVDSEGARIRDRFLIRDGVTENFWGDRQFSEYLGLTDSSQVYNIRVNGGTADEAELRSGDYLELVEFSDFQVDSMTGDIAGEIRLGYLHRGGSVTIVTGGSVSGSLTEALSTMRCSKETIRYDCAMIPRLTMLSGLRITPAAEGGM